MISWYLFKGISSVLNVQIALHVPFMHHLYISQVKGSKDWGFKETDTFIQQWHIIDQIDQKWQ